MEQGLTFQVEHLLNQKELSQPIVDNFHYNFIANGRGRELDGLIKRNQRIVEAIDDLGRIDLNVLNKFGDNLKTLNNSLYKIKEVKFTQSELQSLPVDNINQMGIKKLADAKIEDSQRLEEKLDVILE